MRVDESDDHRTNLILTYGENFRRNLNLFMKRIIFVISFILALSIPTPTYAFTRDLMGARSIRATVGNNGTTVLNTVQLSAGPVYVGNSVSNTQAYQYVSQLQQQIQLLRQKLNSLNK